MFTAERRPGLRPSQDLWDICIKLGEKHHLHPLEVFKNLLFYGEKIALIEDGNLGQVVWKKSDGTEEAIKVFSHNGHAEAK